MLVCAATFGILHLSLEAVVDFLLLFSVVRPQREIALVAVLLLLCVVAPSVPAAVAVALLHVLPTPPSPL